MKVHLSPAYKSRVGIATPHSEHARDASFWSRDAAIQSAIVKNFDIGTAARYLLSTGRYLLVRYLLGIGFWYEVA